MNCNNCRWFNKTGFVTGFGDCVLNREVHGSNHVCEQYEEYRKMTRLIDANALFDKVGNIKPKNKSEYELIGKFMNMITNSPTITIPVAELDTTEDFGEWIDVNGDGSIMKCSKCGEEVCCKNNNFCPNCGADMRAKEGEAE